MTETDAKLLALKGLLQKGATLYGSQTVLRQLKSGTSLHQVYIAKNCLASVKKELENYARMRNIPVVELELTAEELGVLCKKNFFVAVVGIP